MGSAGNYWQMYNGGDPAIYPKIFKEEYGIATAESVCKWHYIRPDEKTFKLDQCMDFIKMTIANDQSFRLHNLCWGSFNP